MYGSICTQSPLSLPLRTHQSPPLVPLSVPRREQCSPPSLMKIVHTYNGTNAGGKSSETRWNGGDNRGTMGSRYGIRSRFESPGITRLTKINEMVYSLCLSLSLSLDATRSSYPINSPWPRNTRGACYVTGNAYAFSIRANLGEICRYVAAVCNVPFSRAPRR